MLCPSPARACTTVALGLLLMMPAAASAQSPALWVPSVALTRSDEALVLSLAGHDAPQVLGELPPGASVELSVEPGTFTLASLDGLRLIEGDGVADARLHFEASTLDTNAAFDGLVYEPPAGWAGRAAATLRVVQLAAPDDEAGWGIAVHAPLDLAAARATVLADIAEIHGGVQPGRLVAYGPEAYELVSYPGALEEGPMIGVASWGRGRVLAAPDHQMLNMEEFGAVSGAFYLGAIEWLAGTADRGVRVVTYDAGVARWLGEQGYGAVTVVDEAGLAATLAQADVFVPPWLGTSEPEANLEAIGAFVRAGGGLAVADYGVGYQWWWGLPVHAAPSNRLLREAGLGFATGHRWDEGAVALGPLPAPPVGAQELLEMLAAPGDFAPAVLDRGGVLLGRIFDVLAPEDPLALHLDDGFAAAIDAVRPSPDAPVDSTWEQGLLQREASLLDAQPLDAVRPHRTADAVFGAVPEGAARGVRTVHIDPSVTGWHATGVYAAPGERVTLELPPAALGVGYRVRINGHTDDISVRDTWLRPPRVHRSYAVEESPTSVANPFGGAIYIDVGSDRRGAPPFPVTLRGGVAAPLYVHGVTTDEEWVRTERDNPAPYAELVGQRLALSVPAALVRGLDAPSELMAFWEQVVALQDELGAHAALRTGPERINIDVQISVGWLHAGYPIQGPTEAAAELLDLPGLLRSGSWGWFHELGHEAQRRPDKSWGWDNAYTFDGAVEATVNLFTCYVYDHMGMPDRGGWSWTGSRQGVMRRALGALGEGDTFASAEVGAKLALFLELRDSWGWEPVAALIAGYQAAAPAELPEDEQAERDEALLRLSAAVDHDLTPFLRDTWGLEVSDAAVAAQAGRLPWMPALGGIEGERRTRPGQPVTFDLPGEALSHDGIADIAPSTDPREGWLGVLPDGRWAYFPNDDFRGEDFFEYAVVSSTGHVAFSTVTLLVGDEGALLERWWGLPGASIADLTDSPSFPHTPDEVLQVAALEAPADAGDNYGARLRAFVHAPAAGVYTFWLTSDDAGELWLSDDHRPGGVQRIARVPGWAPRYGWDRYPEQRSAPVVLARGEVRYLEALMKEGGGGDHLSVAWAPQDGERELIPTAALRVWRPTNEPPQPQLDHARTTQGVAVRLDLLANDSDPDGDVLLIAEWERPRGAIAEQADGALLYDPGPAFVGEERFRYVVADGYGGVAVAEAVVTVEATAEPDAGTPDPEDAGTPGPQDAGTPDPQDAGTPDPWDTGTPDPLDAGHPDPDDVGGPRPPDAGHPDPDDAGGPRPPDAGHPDPDDVGGPRPPDAGPPDPEDAGRPDPTDAGPPDPEDAGPPDPEDAGPPDPEDAGPPDPEDAGGFDPGDSGQGEPVDAGLPPSLDLGTSDPADVLPPDAGGCSCSQTAPVRVRAVGPVAALVLVFGLWLRRRSRAPRRHPRCPARGPLLG